MVIRLPRRFFVLCLMIGILSGLAGVASGQPALAYPNDQAPASILFFNKYTSNLSTPHLQDTQISVTNTNQNTPIDIHMFLVDGSTCSVADSFISLTPNQTISFFMSDYDPGIQGYIVMVAAAGGTPTQFNYLIGSEFIRESDGHLANLAAVGIQKISPGDVVPNGDGTASLIFNNVEYQRLPTILAVSSFNSQVTHNTNLALYSPSNNLLIGNPQSTTIFALVFDESENPYSTTIRIGCFNQVAITNLRLASGPLNRIVPAGHTGWIRLNATGRPLLGSVLTLARNGSFNGGHNLHTIALLPSYTINIPAF